MLARPAWQDPGYNQTVVKGAALPCLFNPKQLRLRKDPCIMDAIFERASVRAFTSDPVSDE